MVIKTNLPGDSGTFKKIYEIGATSQKDMLAVVDWLWFTRRQKRRGAAAKDGSLFEDIDGEAGLGQAHSGS
ncbi:MAG: hypothetical protein A3F68_04125 [Acidobacteria bacterium RIFCSPLOWO2_12_FULL_54_10]|nr:MAG: hypothetical protein A3F68_04125 [Acidobacteria bacterium RIFCSPLOWO2_12_FULL_54_10]